MLAWLSVWSEVQTCIWPSWCHCHSLSLASVKPRLVLPFWYQLTRVVPDKGPLTGCVWIDCLSVDTHNHVPVLSTSAGLTVDAAKDVWEPASSYYAGYAGQDTDWPRSPKWRFVYISRSRNCRKYYNKGFDSKLTCKLLYCESTTKSKLILSYSNHREYANLLINVNNPPFWSRCLFRGLACRRLRNAL